jgi:predicted RND superfamily exporter protein
VVLALATALSGVSAVIATRIQVKTAFQDTMSDDDPIVRRMSYLSENFPGAVVVQVVLEGTSPERLVAAGEALQAGFLADELDPRLVSHVYLEQDLDFFLRRALLYVPDAELRLLEERLRRHQSTLRTLSADPSLLGLLRGVEAIADDAVPRGSTAVTFKTRLFADVVMSSLLNGRPAADVGVKVDPGPAQAKLNQRINESLKGLPLPPSDTEARRTLAAVEGALDLVADVLEGGDAVDAATFSRRAAALVSLLPQDGGGSSAIPPRYQFSPDRRLLLMEVGSELNLGKLEDIRPVLAHLYGVAERTRADFPDVTIGFTGLPVQYVEEQEAILSNFALVTILGLLGILAVFIVGFEQIALPSLSALPLVMGILWTFGIQGLVDPTLNMLNLLFPVVLFGLGVDTAIHLLNGFAHRRALGDAPEDAVRNMLIELLPGILTGSATTATAFFALMLAHMKGLQTLGFTAGVGVIMAVLAMLVVLPAIFVLYDRRSPVVGMRSDAGPLGHLGVLVGRHRYPILAIFMVLISVAAYHAPSVSLERDSLKMQPRGMPAAVLQEKLLKAFSISGEPSIFFAKDLEEAAAIVARARLAKTVSEPLAITLALPEGQAEKAPLIRAIKRALDTAIPERDPPPRHTYSEAELDEVRTLLANVKAVLLEASVVAAVIYGDDTAAVIGALRDDVNRIERRLADANADRLQLLDTHLRATVENTLGIVGEMSQNTSITFADLPESLKARVGGKDGATMVLVRANGYIGDERFLEAHVAELYAIHGEVAGIVPAWREMLNQILTDMPRLLAVIGVCVVLLVLVGLRSLKGTVLALTPLAVGVVLLLGILGATGTDLNFVSVLSLPLLLGTGIDYGVHLYERIRHDRGLGPAMEHSGKALILSSMTTMIGFGSLMLSVHRGVFGLGLVTSLGIVLCLVVALVLQPALVAIVEPELLEPAPPTTTATTHTSGDHDPSATVAADAVLATTTTDAEHASQAATSLSPPPDDPSQAPT